MTNPAPGSGCSADLLPSLIATVFATLVPATIMTVLFAAVGGLIAVRWPGAGLAPLYGLALAAGVARLALMWRWSRRMGRGAPTIDQARVVERWFGRTYLSFAALLGLFAADAAAWGGPDAKLLASVLVTGFAAGVATGVASRPRIAVAAMLAGVVPVILAAALRATVTDLALAGMMLAFLVGGVRSTLVRYAGIVAELRSRERHAALARRDPLTGLANRLAVDERLALLQRSGRPATLVCVDLDGFKSINDAHGHAAGDAVLVEVGRRLHRLVRATDLVARLGGDEFMLVCDTAGDGPDAIAARIAERLAHPVPWRGAPIMAGASVGTADLPAGGDVERAKARADEELYRAKRAGRPSAATPDRRADPARCLVPAGGQVDDWDGPDPLRRPR